jgi:hypothetical protein
MTRQSRTFFRIRLRARWILTLAGLIGPGVGGVAFAQGSMATIEVRVPAEDHARAGDPAVAVELRSTTDTSLLWTAVIRPGEPAMFRFVPAGQYRIVSGSLERSFHALPGDELTVEIAHPEATVPPAAGDVRVIATDRAGYGTRFESAALERLPRAGGLFGLIERADPLVVTDLMEGGGAYLEMQRLGASGASWTQTSFRLGDADITDPDPTGFPLLYPNLDALEAVSVITAGLPPDGYGGGTSVTLVPRRPSSIWQRNAELFASPHGFQSVNPLPGAPSIASLTSAGGGSFSFSGPLSDRLGIVLTGTLLRSTRTERVRPVSLPGRAQSLTTHVVFSATERDELRVFAQLDRLALPGAGRSTLVDRGLQQHDLFTVVSATWDHGKTSGIAWSGNLTYGRGSSTPALAGVSIAGTMERSREGPVYELAAISPRSRDRLYLGWRGDPGHVNWLGRRHLPRFGVNGSWTHANRDAPGSTVVGELVQGRPARVWNYTSSGESSHWSGVEFAAWATDEFAVTSRVDVDLGLRAAMTGASRDGTSPGIPWRSLSPSILTTTRLLDWGTHGRLSMLAGVARYGARLPLSYLAFGDPNSLSGTVHQWTDRNRDNLFQAGESATTIALVGPCCAAGRPNTIHDDLRTPPTREFLIGMHARLTDRLMLRLGGTDRRQSRLVQAVNAAYDLRNYSLTHVDDPALDMLVTEDDQLLPIFNRLPASFATDRYELQNVDRNSARDHGLDLVLERMFDGRWGMLIGATAHKSEGIGGNRGYRADENDQGVIGEVFSEPNAETFGRGRLFFERGYVVKWSGIWQAPYGLRGSAAARYQDGQHFTRVVIAPGLNQGLDAIPALPRGLTRFTFAFTLDTRVEKTLRIGTKHATIVAELYNLLNTNNEVEEYEIAGPTFRAPTAVQPPRSVRLGVRFSF